MRGGVGITNTGVQEPQDCHLIAPCSRTRFTSDEAPKTSQKGEDGHFWSCRQRNLDGNFCHQGQQHQSRTRRQPLQPCPVRTIPESVIASIKGAYCCAIRWLKGIGHCNIQT